MAQREARGLSRSKASLGSGVPEKSIQRWEIEGVIAPAHGFLALVHFYEADDALIELIRSEGAKEAPVAPPLPGSAIRQVTAGKRRGSGKKEGGAR